MKEFSEEKLDFLSIEIDELKELVLAIKEVGRITPKLMKLAQDKSERIGSFFTETNCSASEPTKAKTEKPPHREAETRTREQVPTKPASNYKIDRNELIAPLAHPSLSEMEYDCSDDLDSPPDPHLYTQPILIETTTAPADIIAILNDRLSASAESLSEVIEKRNAADLRKAFSLNDRFRFQRELFANSATKMEAALTHLNDMQTKTEAVEYLTFDLGLNVEDDVTTDFIRIIEKRFS